MSQRIASAVAGHSKTTTAMNRYAHARQDAAKRGMEAIDKAILCDMVFDSPISRTCSRRKKLKNAWLVIGFVINRHKKRREVFKMTLAAPNPAILWLYKAKTQSFLTGFAS